MNNPMHILVVEDTLIAQQVIARQLMLQGCMVDVASDGAAAIAKAQSAKYDLILMDIGLGEGPDGFEVTSTIKGNCELNKSTVVMAVTAHGDEEYQDKARACGMEGYFYKPFTPKDALVVVEYMKNKFK